MNKMRMRGRNHRPNNGGGSGFRNQQNGIPLNRNHVFDSSGPEMRVRGTAQQLHEKYTQLARDAASVGDRVTSEGYYQHAEHYFRIISAINQAQGQPQQGQHNGQAPYQQNYQQNGYQQGQEQRLDGEAGEAPGAQPGEMRPVQAPARQAEPRPYENRGEPRGQDQGNGEPRQNDQRHNEPRHNNQRYNNNEPRRDRYEPRNQEQRQDRVRPDQQVIDRRIDISSALEAELSGAEASSAPQAAGLGEQPAVRHPMPQAAAPVPAPEARAIPIVANPPPAEATSAEAGRAEAGLTEAGAPQGGDETAPVRRPRGRPRLARNMPVAAPNPEE